MFRLLSKHLRKVTHGIIINLWNVVLFIANLFKCSLHVFPINGIIRKLISKT